MPEKTNINNHFLSARQLFPQMPEEIFTLWLDGRIENNGWPPEGMIWEGALRDKPIEYWGALRWRKSLVNLNYELLTTSSKKIVNGLIDTNFRNQTNEYSILSNSNARIKNILIFIKKYLKLPNPLIFIHENEKWEIVDGSHRLAVFFLLQTISKNGLGLNHSQEAWIGEI